MYTTCRVGILSSEISKHSKISPPPSLRSHLTSSPMGVLSGDYGNTQFNYNALSTYFAWQKDEALQYRVVCEAYVRPVLEVRPSLSQHDRGPC